MNETTELKNIASMPGSINELISINKRLKRPPSLSESFAWTPENIERANRTPLLTTSDDLEIVEESNISSTPSYYKYEVIIIEILIKLLLHITLISIFETLFYFFYVSSLEDNGIEKTVNTFIDNAVNKCSNINFTQIQIIDYILEPYINATKIIEYGNEEEISRNIYNQKLMNIAWSYVGGLLGISTIVVIYIKFRKINIKWKIIIGENVAMVILLALYELMFFDTIIYSYKPISTNEIERNTIEQFQSTCGILK
jgi:hypothetical protein